MFSLQRSQNGKIQGRLPRLRTALQHPIWEEKKKRLPEIQEFQAIIYFVHKNYHILDARKQWHYLRYQITWDQYFVRWLHEIQWAFHGLGFVEKGSFKIARFTSSADLSFSIIHEHWGKIRQWSLGWEFINFLHVFRNVRGVKLRIIKVKLLRYIYCARKNITLSISDSIQCLSVHVSLIGMQGVYLLYCLHLSEKI